MCLYCDRPTRVSGLCDTHRRRKGRGAPMDAPIVPRRGRSYEFLNKVLTYSSAHNRVKALWGSASNYRCVECGGQGRDWAYDHTDPTQLYGEGRWGQVVAFSIWPEYYMPMCKSCHTKLDHGASEEPEDSPPW